MFLLSDRAIKKLLPSFAITSGTKRNCYSSRHSLRYEKRVFSPPWFVNFILSHVIARDGSRFVIPLSERKLLGFYWKDKERIEFYRMVYDECSTVLIIKRQLEVEIY